MKITLDLTTNTITSTTETRFVKNSAGTYRVYIYGVSSSYVVKCTYRKPDGNLVGPINSVYGTDEDSVDCWVNTVPTTALTLAGDIGVSIAVYSQPYWQASIASYWAAHGVAQSAYDITPSKTLADLPTAPVVETAARVNTSTSPAVYQYYVSKVNILTTVRSSGYIYDSDTVEFPEELATEVTNDIYAKINTMEVAKHNKSAIVGTAAEISAGITKDTQVYSKNKTDELMVPKTYLDIDGTLAANSDTKVPTQKAVKTYADKVKSDLADGTTPIIDLDVNGDADISGDMKVHRSVTIDTNLTVLGSSNLTALTITGDDVDVNNNKIINVANGSADGDAINVGQVAFSLGYKQDVSEKGQANGYVPLNSSTKIDSGYLPAIAITKTSVVASEAAQLALTAEEGDVAVRSDEKKSYVHNGGTAGTMDDWTLLQTPTDSVLSVNEKTGAVTLDASDIATDQVGQTIQDALDIIEGDITTAETAIDTLEDTTLPALTNRVSVNEGAITVLQGVDRDNANLDEARRTLSPLVKGTATKASNVLTDSAYFHNLNRIYFKGLTLRNYAKNGNAVNTSNWTASGGTLTASATTNEFTFLASAQNGYFRQAITLVSGHKYYIKVQVSVASNAVSVFMNDGLTDFATVSHTASAGYETLSVVGTAGSSGSFYLTIKDARASGWTSVLVKNIFYTDLTVGGTPPNGTAWASLTASQIDAYIGPLDTTAEILAKAIDGGETNKVTNGTFVANITGWSGTGASWDSATQSARVQGSAGTDAYLYQVNVLTIGKVYYVEFDLAMTSGTCAFNNSSSFSFTTSGKKTLVFTATSTILVFDNVNAEATDYLVDNVLVYDITNYYMTSGLVSFKPNTLANGTFANTDELKTVGLLESLPDGTTYDEFLDSDVVGIHTSTLTKRCHTINLPRESGWTRTSAPTNLAVNGDFAIDTNADGLADNWTAGYGTASIVSGAQRITCDQNGEGELHQNYSFIQGHKYFIKFTVVSATTPVVMAYLSSHQFASELDSDTYSYVVTAQADDAYLAFLVTGLDDSNYFDIDDVFIYDLSSTFNSGSEPDATAFLHYLATIATNTLFEIDLDGLTSYTITKPANCDTVFSNIHFVGPYTMDDFNDMMTAAAPGVAVAPNGKLYLDYFGTSTDTTAELYALLLANPIQITVPITETITHPVIGYITQSGPTMTLTEVSDTCVLAGDWEADYVKDLSVVIDALTARVAALE